MIMILDCTASHPKGTSKIILTLIWLCDCWPLLTESDCKFPEGIAGYHFCEGFIGAILKDKKCFQLLFVLNVNILRSEDACFTITLAPELKLLLFYQSKF